jgi:hypothetical protein
MREEISEFNETDQESESPLSQHKSQVYENEGCGNRTPQPRGHFGRKAHGENSNDRWDPMTSTKIKSKRKLKSISIHYLTPDLQDSGNWIEPGDQIRKLTDSNA